MGEGTSDPNYTLAAWFQQAVGAEHVSDIGVYYDPWRQIGATQAQHPEDWRAAYDRMVRSF